MMTFHRFRSTAEPANKITAEQTATMSTTKAKRGPKKVNIPDPQTKEERDTVAPRTVTEGYRHFARKNINKKTVGFKCAFRCNKTIKCPSTCSYPRLPPSDGRPFGFWDPSKPTIHSLQTRECVVHNRLDPDDPKYDWLGKGQGPLSR
jgi:hypothetical protein